MNIFLRNVVFLIPAMIVLVFALVFHRPPDVVTADKFERIASFFGADIFIEDLVIFQTFFLLGLITMILKNVELVFRILRRHQVVTKATIVILGFLGHELFKEYVVVGEFDDGFRFLGRLMSFLIIISLAILIGKRISGKPLYIVVIVVGFLNILITKVTLTVEFWQKGMEWNLANAIPDIFVTSGLFMIVLIGIGIKLIDGVLNWRDSDWRGIVIGYFCFHGFMGMMFPELFIKGYFSLYFIVAAIFFKKHPYAPIAGLVLSASAFVLNVFGWFDLNALISEQQAFVNLRCAGEIFKSVCFGTYFLALLILRSKERDNRLAQ